MSARGYISAKKSLSKIKEKIKEKFSGVVHGEQLENPNFDRLLEDNNIRTNATKHLKAEINSGVFDSSKRQQFARETVSNLVRKYYDSSFKSLGLGKKIVGFGKRLGLTSLLGATIGYMANGEEGAVVGAQYGASGC